MKQETKIKRVFNSIKKYIFIVLFIINIIIIITALQKININFIQIIRIIPLLLLLSFSFIFLKSLKLKLIDKILQLNKKLIYYVKLFCKSCFIETTTFTGKIGSDVYKYFKIKTHTKNKRKLLIYFRLSDFFAYIILLSLIFLQINFTFITIITLTVLILMSIFYFTKFIQKNKKRLFTIIIISLIIISLLNFIIVTFEFLIVFYFFNITINSNLITIIIISYGLGVISQIPLGLGIKDLSLITQLKKIINQNQIIIIINTVRFFCELPPTIIGGLIILKKHFHNEKNNK